VADLGHGEQRTDEEHGNGDGRIGAVDDFQRDGHVSVGEQWRNQ